MISGALAWSILAAWLMGDRVAAEVYVERVMQRAQQIDHAFSLGIALTIGPMETRTAMLRRRGASVHAMEERIAASPCKPACWIGMPSLSWRAGPHASAALLVAVVV